MTSGREMRSIVKAHRDAAAAELKTITPELNGLKRRLSDKARYLVSLVEPRLAAISHPLLADAAASDDAKAGEFSDRLAAAIDSAAVTAARIEQLEASIADGRAVDGQVLRRYLTLTNKVSEAGAALAREATTSSRARQESTSFHGEQGVERAGEKLAALESELELLVETHGGDLVERASSLAAFGRELAAARVEKLKMDGVVSTRTDVLNGWTAGRRARLVRAVAHGMMSDPDAASTVLADDAAASEAVVRFLSENPDLSDQLSRGEFLAEQAAKTTSRMQFSQTALRALDQSNWSQNPGRFPLASDSELLALSYDEGAMVRIQEFCDEHYIPPTFAGELSSQSMSRSYGRRIGGANAFNRN